ncbi:type I methionyl aminopeptidase [Candidatus Gottesmanbacteria bacterium RIFCSPHIGHO2_01_FULL_42_12]|uniref:Methionine aminopeptidase n=1 Tax=Candidatus Gottesmanbacteria bacterium RIFCSPHIGHO2_01_FULL_42_12 TaxID=1798377 RepID=A0A1F5Z5X9_9BACT|nr:MAG: type I methionyl aminopeptidase [Candidatus Gottesmanbacteria bacterium RIFCSPHIGHO2_01_FULL_42_12]
MKINILTPSELDKIREGGKITAMVIKSVLDKAIPGVTTNELDKYACDLIQKAGGYPSFKMEKGYFWTTCMNVNDTVVHGIPGDYKLADGDRLGLDVGTFYKGFHTDASWSKIIGQQTTDNRLQKFLSTGEEALSEAIKMAVPGNHIGHISQKIQEIVEGGGYSCVKQLVGHGVGRQLHEDPEIPCFIRGKVEKTPIIREGMCLAIEIIYNEGKSPIVYGNSDGWTVVTRDGSLSGLFEHTVIITKSGPVIATTP